MFDNLHCRRNYFCFGGLTKYPGDTAEGLPRHIQIMLKNQRVLIREEDLIECIKTGAVKVPPKSSYYKKSLEILGEQPVSEPDPEPTPVEEEVVEPEVVEDPEPEETEEEIVESESEEPKSGLYTREDLESLKMGDLQEIGHYYDVTDNTKSELVDKILEAQSKE